MLKVSLAFLSLYVELLINFLKTFNSLQVSGMHKASQDKNRPYLEEQIGRLLENEFHKNKKKSTADNEIKEEVIGDWEDWTPVIFIINIHNYMPQSIFFTSIQGNDISIRDVYNGASKTPNKKISRRNDA